MFCACEIMHPLSVVFYVDRAVRNSGIRLVVNEISNKWRPVKEGYVVIGSCVFNRICVFSADRSGEFYGALPTL